MTNLSGLGRLGRAGNSIIIQGTRLTELTGLGGLISVGGNLELHSNRDIVNLNGLDNLVSVDGTLSISGNNSLSDLSGIESLTYLGNGMVISGNRSLANLNGLQGLEDVNGSLEITDNLALKGLQGLESVKRLRHAKVDAGLKDGEFKSILQPGSLRVTGNQTLVNLNGLEGIAEVDGDVEIKSNQGLETLDGLQNLVTIGGDLIIGKKILILDSGNPDLVSLDGLSGLRTVHGQLFIAHNGSLLSLTGLDSINPHGLNSLVVRYNDALGTCDVHSVCNFLSLYPEKAFVYGNAPGCNSETEVLDACLVAGGGMQIPPLLSFIPNPFTESVGISFFMAEPGWVNIELMDARGRQVFQMKRNNCQAGINSIVPDIRHLAPGLYFCRLQTGKGTVTEKVVKL